MKNMHICPEKKIARKIQRNVMLSPVRADCVRRARLTRLPDHQNGVKDIVHFVREKPCAPPPSFLTFKSLKKNYFRFFYELFFIYVDCLEISPKFNQLQQGNMHFFQRLFCTGFLRPMLWLSEVHISQTPHLNSIFWTFRVF